MNLPRWRSDILKALPEVQSHLEWVERRFDRCESDLERVFVMLVAVTRFDIDNLSYAGQFPPGRSGIGKFYTIDLQQQVRVLDYRCDFIVSISSVSEDKARRIAVECDGHSFHDRTREQASYDRRRDRRLLAEGVPTLRYTYSDLIENPTGSMRDLTGTLQALARELCPEAKMAAGL